MPKEKINILFLCTGNSCRSQIAQGWAEHLKSDTIEAFSAGIIPIGVNAHAIEVMKEAGVDISHHTSKHIDDLQGLDFDYVITLCDSAKENCPILPNAVKTIHKPFHDPVGTIGSTQQILEAFRKIRDQIKQFVETLPDSLDK